MQKFNLETFEAITLISKVYEDDITDFLIEEYEDVEHLEFAQLVMDLFIAYTKNENSHRNMLDRIYNHKISLNTVI